MEGLLKSLENYEAHVPKTEHWLDDSSKVEVALGDLRKLRDTRSLRATFARTHTSTYSVLEVKPRTWQDIHDRIENVAMLDEYYDESEGLLIFGTVALRAEVEDDGETPGILKSEAVFLALAYNQGGAFRYNPQAYKTKIELQILIGMQQKGLVELINDDLSTFVGLTKKGLRIVKTLDVEVSVNGRTTRVPAEVSYEEICRVSHPEETRPSQFDDVWTCSYHGRAPGISSDGMLSKGQTVRPMWGTSFTCVDTGQA